MGWLTQYGMPRYLQVSIPFKIPLDHFGFGGSTG